MSTKSYTVGYLTQRAKISHSTLRAWEKLRLIPVPDRSSDGRRQYSEQEVEVICDVAERRREEDPMKWRRPAR